MMRIAMTRLVVAAGMFALGAGLASPANAGEAFTLTNTVDFRNASWAFGEIFTVGSSNITVTALGAYDAGGDGFVTTGGIPVGIFDESTSTLLASTNVLSTDPLVNDFRYHTITSLTLLSGHQYDVVAVNENDLYNISGTPPTVDPSITLNGYAYGQSTSLVQLSDFTGGTSPLWMSNFEISGSTAVPEPSTIVSASMAVLVGYGYSRFRRKRTTK